MQKSSYPEFRLRVVGNFVQSLDRPLSYEQALVSISMLCLSFWKQFNRSHLLARSIFHSLFFFLFKYLNRPIIGESKRKLIPLTFCRLVFIQNSRYHNLRMCLIKDLCWYFSHEEEVDKYVLSEVNIGSMSLKKIRKQFADFYRYMVMQKGLNSKSSSVEECKNIVLSKLLSDDINLGFSFMEFDQLMLAWHESSYIGPTSVISNFVKSTNRAFAAVFAVLDVDSSSRIYSLALQIAHMLSLVKCCFEKAMCEFDLNSSWILRRNLPYGLREPFPKNELSAIILALRRFLYKWIKLPFFDSKVFIMERLSRMVFALTQMKDSDEVGELVIEGLDCGILSYIPNPNATFNNHGFHEAEVHTDEGHDRKRSRIDFLGAGGGV